MTQFTLNLETIDLSDEQFFQLCQNNRDLRFERNFNGELVIMSPAGGETSNRAEPGDEGTRDEPTKY